MGKHRRDPWWKSWITPRLRPVARRFMRARRRFKARAFKDKVFITIRVLGETIFWLAMAGVVSLFVFSMLNDRI